MTMRVYMTILLVKVMAWRRTGDKPLSERMMTNTLAKTKWNTEQLVCLKWFRWKDVSYLTYLFTYVLHTVGKLHIWYDSIIDTLNHIITVVLICSIRMDQTGIRLILSDYIWRQRSGSTLAQVMGGCLTTRSHCLNQYWLIIRGALWH